MSRIPPLPAIDADVARAATLERAFYLDPALWALARERIFARSWQWIGELGDDVAEPGSLAPRTLLPGLLDEPLVLARDGAGTLRCLSNVCTHRGNLLVHEPCRAATQIRCGYHSRRFDLEGRMVFMPGFEGACDFPSERDHLPQLPFGAWHGLAFAALEPAPVPLTALLGVIDARIGALPIEHWRHDPERDRSFELDAHWALYVENYLEGLHIPFVHPGLATALVTGDYRYELFDWCNLQVGLARAGQAAFEPADGPAAAAAAAAGERVAAWYFWVWPNLMLNFYPWGLSLNQVQPLAPERTRVVFRSFVADEGRLGAGAGGALDPVEMEDEAVVLTVQRGIRSRLYRGGRYSPRHERGVHQFHRLIVQALDP